MVKKEVIGLAIILVGCVLLILFFALSNNFSNITIGNAILENQRDKSIAYGIFIVIISIGMVLIVMSTWRKKKRIKKKG